MLILDVMFVVVDIIIVLLLADSLLNLDVSLVLNVMKCVAGDQK